MGINEYFEIEMAYDITPGLSIMNVLDSKMNKQGIFYFIIRKSDPKLYNLYNTNQFSDKDEIIKISFFDAVYVGENILDEQSKHYMIHFISSEWIDSIFEDNKIYNTFWDYMIHRMNEDSGYFNFTDLKIPDYSKLITK